MIYELHVGSFTPAGNFAGVSKRLDYLAELGVTALEIMPVADFPGRRNWGYDGVLPFAPDAAYGRPEDFKRLVAAAHERGLMVLLDVVYNHFGPEGNYLHAYAPTFFNPQHDTPWGAAINFDGEGSRTVRDFFIHNALYWIEEFHLDGLRLDAIHAICDDSSPDIVEELGAAVRDGPGSERHVHLVLENDRNQARYLARDESRRWRYGTAQWNDDIHHVLHVLASGESDGYYADYAAEPARLLGRCLTEGFAYQGEASAFRDGELRGEPSATCRRPPSSISCRPTTRSATAPSANACAIWPARRRWRPSPRCCCWRRNRPCCSWARNSPRRSPSCSSATSAPNWRAPSPKAAAASSPASPASPTRPCANASPTPMPRQRLPPACSTGMPSQARRTTPYSNCIAACWRCAGSGSRRAWPAWATAAPQLQASVGTRAGASAWRLGDGSRLSLPANLGDEADRNGAGQRQPIFATAKLDDDCSAAAICRPGRWPGICKRRRDMSRRKPPATRQEGAGATRRPLRHCHRV